MEQDPTELPLYTAKEIEAMIKERDEYLERTKNTENAENTE